MQCIYTRQYGLGALRVGFLGRLSLEGLAQVIVLLPWSFVNEKPQIMSFQSNHSAMSPAVLTFDHSHVGD